MTIFIKTNMEGLPESCYRAGFANPCPMFRANWNGDREFCAADVDCEIYFPLQNDKDMPRPEACPLVEGELK